MGVLVSNCSSSVIGRVAGLLTIPLGVVPENFIFNPLFVAMVEHYLLDRSGRPLFDISLLFSGFPVCGTIDGQECNYGTNEKTRESAIRHTKE